ncbi:MAG: aldehyde dehydrogenase family protein, partial [Planctomycetes bacterium]|nr:aldehyde dehydrogenase family protein [Planctomycetota bacterium]
MQACANWIDGGPQPSRADQWLDVTNPATGAVIARVPLSTAEEVEQAVQSAERAFADWGCWPPVERARVMFRFQQVLRDHFDELARLIVEDNGKTLAEAKGSVQRGIEVVEFAAGIPSLGMGDVLKDIAPGVDCEMIRQPLGVVAGFTPFNFPVMVPLWMIPIALACGNTFVLKPSERAPLAGLRIAELFAECGAPPGTWNVLHGTARVAEQLMADPRIQAVSVVGSSPIA